MQIIHLIVVIHQYTPKYSPKQSVKIWRSRVFVVSMLKEAISMTGTSMHHLQPFLSLTQN